MPNVCHKSCTFCDPEHTSREHEDSLEYQQYKKIRPHLIKFRAQLEAEILQGRKQKLPPHIIIDKILKFEKQGLQHSLPATDDVIFNYQLTKLQEQVEKPLLSRDLPED